jgi:hypothetical protein
MRGELKIGKGLALGARDPDLSTAVCQLPKQGPSAEGVKMSGHFVEQQDRSPTGFFSNQIGVSEDNARPQYPACGL